MLFLTLDCFNNIGGIQNVCRTMAYTLSTIWKSDTSRVSHFRMFSLYDTCPDTRYVRPERFKCFNGRKFGFSASIIFNCYRHKIFLISHINLLPIAVFVKLLNKKSNLIMLAHGTEAWRKIPSWKRWFINKYVRIWAVSNFTKQSLERQHNFNPTNIEILNNALDPFFIPPLAFNKPEYLLKRYELSDNQMILLTISRRSRHDTDKGYDKVIELIPQLITEFPSLHYLICGKSDRYENIRLNRIIRENNLNDYISLVDFIHEDELQSHYLLADTFVLPSKKEGFGLVFIEAAICGCKVISGDIDGSTDAMLNGDIGVLVDPDNKIALKKAIIASLKKPHDIQAALEIQRKCLMHFNQRAYQQKVINLLLKAEYNL